MKKIILATSLIFSGVSISNAQESTTTTKEKSNQLNEVSIVKEKKAVEQKSDRTIFEFASQSYLNSGSVLEGVKKLPGLVASEVAGMMYQGKQLDVFLDGRPLNISSNELTTFLEGMPANSVEKIEIITNPGAEFPATSGGAILNIITNKKAKNYLSATYTNSTNFTVYDHLRVRTNNSLMLNAKNKYFGWQFNVGQNYAERALWSSVIKKENNLTTVLSNTEADRINRGTFTKSALTFDLGNDRLLLNYDLFYNKNNSYTDAYGTLGDNTIFETSDKGDTKNVRQDAVVTYQKRFADKAKKLDFRFNYSQNDVDFGLNSYISNTNVLNNASGQKVYNFKADYSQPIKVLEKGKISFGTLYEELHFDTKNQGISNLEYRRRTASTYLEFQTKYKKFDFTVGGRGEDYDITGKTNTGSLTPFQQYRFFPNASLQYNFIPQVFFSANYNKKITLPSTSALNPNNTTYANPNVIVKGNPQLQPTIFDNYEVKVSAFDYIFVGYNMSVGNNQVVQRLTVDGNQTTNTNINVRELKVHNFNIGMPIPYMLFTKGMSETVKVMSNGGVNPDKINFLYVYAGRQKHEIPDINTKPYWIVNLMSQVVLPKEIKWVTNYSHVTAKGNFYYFVTQKPYGESLDTSFSKKFLGDQLTVSVNFDDILNTNRSVFQSFETPIYASNKSDTRRFGFTVNYKIPTKNKLAKEDPNLLNKEKKEDNGNVIGN
ncbi:TonB-dependent receptor [Flavobacterium amnicola]|uniref:TonB-dependent receptor n=1 Tax=Flavobacterium amnicola TaxID=2506422 RepID=A0A4Q1K2D2_9FLAO|nr:TonB-dependent receptor [Flavobacterium amnicola]RXR18280.1 TonB-dependent receptor [Flavobacterium amnicola]